MKDAVEIAVGSEEPEDDVEGAASRPEDEERAGRDEQVESGERLVSIVESLLFVAGSPLPLRKIAEVLDGPPVREIKKALGVIRRRLEERKSGIRLVSVAGGFQLRTAMENADWVRSLLRERPARLGRAAMETLAVIAYKQPVTRAEIEAVRGVDADSALSTLLSKRLIRIAGRKEAVGRPLMYATTPEFLEVFGLRDLGELPALKEIGPAPEPEDEALKDDKDGYLRSVAENSEPCGDRVAPAGGGDDPLGPGNGERTSGDGTWDESGSQEGSNYS